MNLQLIPRQTMLIAVGGAIGAVARFWCAEFVHVFFERGFPFGTLSVNVVGSFLMGFLSILLFYKFSFAEEFRSLLLIGMLGAFTTFSTFSLDTINLFAEGKIWFGVMNVVLSVLLCLAAAGVGVWLAYRV